MLAAPGLIDLIVPRGGKGLVERVQREARVPVLAHAEGLNHTYIHEAADFAMARDARQMPKCAAPAFAAPPRPCCSMPPSPPRCCRCWWPALARWAAPSAPMPLPAPSARNCRPRQRGFRHRMAGCDAVRRRGGRVDEALAHIAAHGSEHTDAIITEDAEVAEHFLPARYAVGMWNASTQFCDGGEFGFGGEIGIATGRIHARGPSGSSSSRRSAIWCAAPARCGPEYPEIGDRGALRVGLLGGSFNPAHEGHLHVARQAVTRLRLHQVWLMVSPGNPLKPAAGMAPLEERLASARAIADGRRIIATDIEARSAPATRRTRCANCDAAFRRRNSCG